MDDSKRRWAMVRSVFVARRVGVERNGGYDEAYRARVLLASQNG